MPTINGITELILCQGCGGFIMRPALELHNIIVVCPRCGSVLMNGPPEGWDVMPAEHLARLPQVERLMIEEVQRKVRQ
jgi:uncharacterized paraquat-inducible protein A